MSEKPSIKVTNRFEKQSYAAIIDSIPAQTPEEPWTQVKYKNRKPSQQKPVSLTLNAGYQGKKILFPRERTSPQISETDLMLVLVGVDKIIRIVLPSLGPISPYIHELVS